MIPLPPFTESERVTLEQLASSLRARGWASHVTVELLLREWLNFTSKVEDNRFLPYEFADYLRSRDALEEMLGECPTPLVDKLKGIISPADERYRAQTREDGGTASPDSTEIPAVPGGGCAAPTPDSSALPRRR